MVKSFKSTCQKVKSLKDFIRLLHKWLLRFLVRFFSPIYRSLFVSYTANICCIHIDIYKIYFSFFYYSWDGKWKKNKFLFLDYICLPLDLINVFNINYYLINLTFSPIFERCICYLLALHSRCRKSEAFLLFTCFLPKGAVSYPVWSQFFPHVETIYLVCMTNRLNGVLYNGKAGCKCLNWIAVPFLTVLMSN